MLFTDYFTPGIPRDLFRGRIKINNDSVFIQYGKSDGEILRNDIVHPLFFHRIHLTAFITTKKPSSFKALPGFKSVGSSCWGHRNGNR